MFTRTYRVLVAAKLIVTVLAPCVNVRPDEATMFVNVEPLALPSTDRVWVRVPQPLGSLRITWSMLVDAPRSTCAHCGNELFVLSQYESGLPSLRLPVTKAPL